MTKRILAIILCVVMLCPALFGCAKKDDKDPGAYITMYLTDNIFDFDPANAFYNSDADNVLSMMYETLFTLDDNGKVKKSLVKDYEIVENKEANEYYIEMTLKEAYWNTKDQITANDVVYAWQRLVDFRNGYDAASLLFDIKNARAVKEGDVSIDLLGVEAVEDLVIRVSFDTPIDYDRFFLSLTNVATAPLLRRYVSINPDWAKKSSDIATSGPFKLGRIAYKETGEEVSDDNRVLPNGTVNTKPKNKVKVIDYFYLERNLYYYRDVERDALDESVTPYRLLVKCDVEDSVLLQEFKDNKLFYIGNIPLSLRNADEATTKWLQKEAKISNALSTFVCYLNENALIDDGGDGTYLFANQKVRQALSLAIDREAIVKTVLFAEAATGLVPPGVFDKGNTGDFTTSKLASKLIASTANATEATALLEGIDPTKYSFTIKVAAYDEIHLAIAEQIKNAWTGLKFNVEIELAYAIENNDYYDKTASTPPDVCDDQFIEAIQSGDYEVAALDLTAFTADAYSVLSNLAYAFSGTMYSDPINDIYEYGTHTTGYDSVEYNIMMEAIYYLPYFANLDNTADAYYQSIRTKLPYVESANSAIRKLNDAVKSAEAAVNAALAAMVPAAEDEAIAKNVQDTHAKALQAQIQVLRDAAKQSEKNLNASKPSAETLAAAQAASVAATAKTKDLIATAEKVVADVAALTTKADNEALNATAAKVTALANSLKETVDSAKAALTAMDAAAKTVNNVTLYDAVKAIYDANSIVPTTKTSKLAEQRSVLLHKAEELLLTDMPIIPVIFNQDAVLIHKDLSKVDATYYAPVFFRKTKLKDYDKYVYTYEEVKNGQTVQEKESIFKKFPEIKWDQMDK